MKTSTELLPKTTQKELKYLTSLILQYVKDCQMILLFGSYARGDYVFRDDQIEFGINTSYMSDYDILIILNNANVGKTEHIIRDKVRKKYDQIYNANERAIPRIIVENIATVNSNLQKCQYFFTDIITDGILLYNSENFQLEDPRELSFLDIKKIAEEEFEAFYHRGVNLLMHGKIDYENHFYVDASFQLHQSCERFYNAISLVYTNYRPKGHKLEELAPKIWNHSNELVTIFPFDTDFEKHCFDLICRAYIEARYNKDFSVTKEECDYMIQRLEILKEVTNRICTERIEHYNKLAQI